MNTIRLGIIGLGNMGATHARGIATGKIPGLELAAVADVDAPRLAEFPGAAHFATGEELIESAEIDAVLICTPHFSHTPLGIATLEKGLHLLVEKPISVHKADCERLLAAAGKNRELVFAAMFNQRTDPYYQKIRHLITSGELGEIRRVNWIITNWFRTAAYYASSGWRATWGGEGGGVLLNQCPHNLDLFQWMFGLPKKVRAFCQFGRYHDIEVEDDVTAYLEFPGGATGVFITSTGEAPGTNRLEITAENGKLVYENDRLIFTRNEQAMSEFSATSDQAFAAPAIWNVEIPVNGHGEQHLGILRNFANAILRGETLIAPGAEGIHSVELANAILQSALEDRAIEFPIDGAAYADKLQQLAAQSQRGEKVVRAARVDFAASQNR